MTWASVPAMSVARRWHTATLLPSGKVLLVGGANNVPAAVSTTEIYDPTTNTWTTAASMAGPRQYHSATLLVSGKVFVMGGNASGGSTGEIYDPATNAWTLTGPAATVHWDHAAVRLADGKVLVAGGYITDATDVFDPVAGTWKAMPKMPAGARVHPYAQLLSTGKVLVVGGRVDCELFDPATSTWAATSPVAVGHESPAFTLGQAGKVLAGGGWDGKAFLSLVESYDPATGKWTKVGDLKRGNGPAVVLADGRLVAPGGYLGDKGVDLFDPTTGTSTAITPMSIGRTDHTVTALADGRVLVAGGTTGGANLSTAEIFALLANGETCATARAAECASKTCVDGVCCDTACTEACKACDVATKVGTCSPVPSGAPHGARSCSPYATCAAGACAATCTADGDCTGTSWCGGGACKPKKPAGEACAEDRECTSTACTDGVCCDARCDGQCEACDVPSAKGKCLPIPANERPHGKRTACVGEGIGTTCGIRCDGAERAKCTYPTPLAVCGKDSCVGGVETHASVCDGAGKCNDTPRSCGTYQCSSDVCKTTCAADTDCITLHRCVASKCVPKVAHCADDGRASIGADDTVTPCHPYTCKEARCATECTATTDCAPGFVCDPSNKACVPATPPAADSGGCAIAQRGTSGTWLSALLLLGLRRRRFAPTA